MTNEQTFDPAIQSENIAFSADEMVVCGKCDRRNAPDRSACIYCGERLETFVHIQTNTRIAEDWEPAFNIIVTGGETGGGELTTAAETRGVGLPISRIAESSDADAAITEFSSQGIKAQLIHDEHLAIDFPHVRLSTIEFENNGIGLVDLNTRDVTSANFDDVVLIVVGTLFRSRIDMMEKRKRGADAKLLDESTAADHEPVIDIYIRDDARGFRVLSSGFDFRCLGSEMTLFAAKNMSLLVERLRSSLPDAKFVDCYREVRPFLEAVWPTTHRREAMGIVRSGLGQKGFGRSETSSNAEQFDRFSRTQFLIL
ncbi:MAG TPA: hypothetical protein PKA82_17340 [Pyrinomonadaceae bacterium]|nr:hypothetical protein [Pyrinomonadaceae bacterium]